VNNYYSDIEKMIEMKKRNSKRSYDDLIKSGIQAQIQKLQLNEHKQPIEEHSFLELKLLLNEEYGELMTEFFNLSYYDKQCCIKKKRKRSSV